MTTVAEGDKWNKDIGIFEYEVNNHDDHTDDDWKDGAGFGAHFLDLNQNYTDGITCLSNLIVTDYSIVEDPVIKITKLASRVNFKLGTGAAQATVTFKCLCIDDITNSAEDKANRIIEFCRRHKRMTNKDIYLVMRRKVSGTYKYWEWEDKADNFDRKWLQVSVTSSKPKYKSYGVIEVSIQCEEVNT